MMEKPKALQPTPYPLRGPRFLRASRSGAAELGRSAIELEGVIRIIKTVNGI